MSSQFLLRICLEYAAREGIETDRIAMLRRHAERYEKAGYKVDDVQQNQIS